LQRDLPVKPGSQAGKKLPFLKNQHFFKKTVLLRNRPNQGKLLKKAQTPYRR
jgi:hypothetical protein